MSRLRNVVLAGHSDSGKTTLAEHLLYTAGAINRLGRVDDGTASLDFEPEEHKRKQSLSLAADHGPRRLRDHAHRHARICRFRRARSSRASRRRTRALITMDASGGVEAGTRRPSAWDARTHTPAIFVITRCERENADPMAALDALRAAFGNKIAPLQLAIGKADAFRGYVDLVHRKAWVYEGGKRRRWRSPPSWPTRWPAATSSSRPRPRPTTTS